MLILEGTLENIGEKQEEESTFFLFFYTNHHSEVEFVLPTPWN